MSAIVLPVVRSPAGERAVELAKEEAAERGAELILVGTAAVTDRVGESVEALRKYITRLEKQLADEGVAVRAEWSVGGSLGEATLEAARAHDAELIVLGLRRRSPVGKALLGSFEQEILLDAPCPVLSVRGPLH